MAVIITTSTIALSLVLFDKYEKRFDWLKIAFFILTFVACIHYNYGNDYKAYYWNWEFISDNSLKTLIISNGYGFYKNIKPEVGWIFLNKLFGFHNGFYFMVAFMNIVEGIIYYKFIKRFVPKRMCFWAFFLYVFTYKYYLLNFSMMRQGFAMTLVLLSFLFFCKKKYIMTLVILAIAISIHTSSLIIVPFLMLCKFEEKMKLQIYGLIILIITLLFFFATSFSSKLFDLIVSLPFFTDYKTFYTGNLSTNSIGFGFALLTIPYFVMLYYMIYKPRDITVEEKYLIILAYIAFLTKPFEFIGTSLVSRIGYIFSMFDIAIIPVMYSKIKQPVIRFGLYLSLVVITVYSYIGFYMDPTYQKAFAEFHTIFELF